VTSRSIIRDPSPSGQRNVDGETEHDDRRDNCPDSDDDRGEVVCETGAARGTVNNRQHQRDDEIHCDRRGEAT
jgi:hypothetical protein